MESVYVKNRAIVTAVIYGTLLLDNILLTVIGKHLNSTAKLGHISFHPF